MIYDIAQTTRYDYGEAVHSSRHIMRMRPPNSERQRVIAASIIIDPAPSEIKDGLDFFGNHVTRCGIEKAHHELTVTVKARVRVEPPVPLLAELTLPWEQIAHDALSTRDFSAHAPAHKLFPSRMVPIDPIMTAYAAQSFTPGRPVLEAALELNNRIKADFIYDPSATAVDTDPRHAFALRRGVCQDFAHVMIAGLRGLGVPAGYVSGWLRTIPPPGQERLAGSDATHAWVSLWCGPNGWVGLDPTNGIVVGEDHVLLAEGRDYADVAPLDGVIWSAADHALSVAVDVVPVEGSSTDEG